MHLFDSKIFTALFNILLVGLGCANRDLPQVDPKPRPPHQKPSTDESTKLDLPMDNSEPSYDDWQYDNMGIQAKTSVGYKDKNTPQIEDIDYQSSGKKQYTIEELINDACTGITKITIDSDFTQEINYLCNAGEAKPEFYDLINNAYDGKIGRSGSSNNSQSGKSGSVKTDTNNWLETELFITSAVKLEKSMIEVNEKLERMLAISYSSRGLKTTLKIIEKSAPLDTTYRESYVLEKNLSPVFVFPPVFNRVRNIAQLVSLDNPNINFQYKYLKDDERVNRGDRIDRQITFVIGVNPSLTFIVIITHLTTTNLGFPFIANWYAKDQSSDLAEVIYRVNNSP